jgi:hypothetical protein
VHDRLYFVEQRESEGRVMETIGLFALLVGLVLCGIVILDIIENVK